MRLILICTILFFAFVVDADKVFKTTFNKPHDPSDPDSPWAYSFTDLANLEVTNHISEGRLNQIVNPFTTTVPQGPTGGLDHVKVLQYLKEPTIATGEGIIRFNARMGAQHYNVSDHPFPNSRVRNPEDDLRLANCMLNLIDLNTFVVADFVLTNTGIWAFYERLPFGRTPSNNYHSFTQVKKVLQRTPDQLHRLSIEYNAPFGSISWYIDNEVVMNVFTIGHPLVGTGVVTIIDLGGVDQVVSPTGFSSGFGCFTILDAVDPNNPDGVGLVKLDNTPGQYVAPASFHDTNSMSYNRLWGQGSILTVGSFNINSK